jgi:hypothetical protein
MLLNLNLVLPSNPPIRGCGCGCDLMVRLMDMSGVEAEMEVKPKFLAEWYRGSDKLKDKVALITGVVCHLSFMLSILSILL